MVLFFIASGLRPTPRLSHTCLTRSLQCAPSTSRTLHSANVLFRKKHVNVEPPPEEDIPQKKGKSRGMLAAELKPASQSKVSPEAEGECDKAKEKMDNCVEWYRKEMSMWENRALGKVTPAILDGVKVHLQGKPENETVKLVEVATVGIKEGTVLVVTVFDEHNMKAVEKAIYAANIPQLVPQKMDARTIRIPMPKPTVEGKAVLAKEAAKEAENTKKKIRAVREVGVKQLTKLGFGKFSEELKAMQALTDKATEEIDKISQRLRS